MPRAAVWRLQNKRRNRAASQPVRILELSGGNMQVSLIALVFGTFLTSTSLGAQQSQAAREVQPQDAARSDLQAHGMTPSALSRAKDIVSLSDFGALGDETQDYTMPVQAAFRWATEKRAGRRLMCPDGVYRLSSTIVIANVDGLAFVGQGSCVFIWQGNPNSPMFDLEDVSYSRFEGFRIRGNTAHRLAVVFHIANGGATSVTPHCDQFVNISIEGVDGYIDYGFRIARDGAGGDRNDDFHYFENVRVNNYAIAAWSLEATQAHFIHFLNCFCLGGRSGQYCVSGGRDAGARTSFVWDGGFSGMNSKADFMLECNTSRQPYVIRNLSSERSNRFIDSTGPCGSTSPLTIEDVRWSDTDLNPDGAVIRYLNPGPISLRDSRFGDGPKRPIRIVWDYISHITDGYGPSFIITNTNILGTLAAAQEIFPGRKPNSMQGVFGVTSVTANSLDSQPTTGRQTH